MLLKFDREQEWLEARKQDVTSTEIAALFGLHPYKSRLRLWHEKKGNIESDFEETSFSKWGRRLQIPVAMGICEDEGWSGQDLTGMYARDPEIRNGASFDVRVQCSQRGSGHLEVKVAETFSEEQGWFKDKAPIQYEMQLQNQLHRLRQEAPEITWGVIGTLGKRQSTRLYFREYDVRFGEMIDEECRSFWQSIKENKEPKPDFTVDSELIEKMRKPLRLGDTIILTGNNRAHDLAETFYLKRAEKKILSEQVNKFDLELDTIKTELLHIIGRNDKAIIGPYTISAKEQVTEEYLHPGTAYRRFDFTKKKGK